jgi:hypothetical protein
MSSTASSNRPRADGPVPSAPAPRRALIGGLAALIPVITFILYAITMPGLLRGEHAGLYVTAAALAERGGFAIDGQIAALAASDADGSPASLPRVAYFAGHYYVARPPGLAALATPLYLLGIVAAPLLGPEAPLIAVALLGPLLAALVSLGLVRSADRGEEGAAEVAPPHEQQGEQDRQCPSPSWSSACRSTAPGRWRC